MGFVGLWWVLVACAPAPDEAPALAAPVTEVVTSVPSSASEPTGPRIVDGPAVHVPDDIDAYGVGELSVSTEGPTTLSLRIVDPCGERLLAWPEEREVHHVTVPGFHLGARHELTVILEGSDGAVEHRLPDLVAPLPAGLPGLEVMAHDPDALGRGLLVVAPIGLLQPSWVLAYDEALHPVYALRRQVEDLRLQQGRWLALHEGEGVEWDLLGRPLTTWGEEFLHHELFPLPDGGVLTLAHEVVTESAYPVDAEATETTEADLRSQAILRLSAEGELVERFSLADLLDTTQVGFESLEAGTPRDWSHANAVVPWGDDAYLVSVRHLDVVAAVNRDGTLRWLLGDPAGWQAPWSDAFLQPVGELTWFRHAHAVEVDEGGVVRMFDNGNFGGSPASPPPDDYVPQSRGLALQVDEVAGTVQMLWERSHEGLFSPAMGDIDVWPTGEVLLTFSAPASLPLQSRLVVLPPEEGPALLDVLLTGGNRYTYRAQWVDTLVDDTVTDVRW